MKVKALVSGFDLTEGKIYDVIFEYDTVYELKCDTGTYCRNKDFFEIVKEPEIRTLEELAESEELCQYCSDTDYGEHKEYSTPNGCVFCEGAYCDRAYEAYLEEIGAES